MNNFFKTNWEEILKLNVCEFQWDEDNDWLKMGFKNDDIHIYVEFSVDCDNVKFIQCHAHSTDIIYENPKYYDELYRKFLNKLKEHIAKL